MIQMITSLLIFLYASAVLSLQSPINIEGKYICEGYDSSTKTSYQGPGFIKKTGNTYSFKWDFGKQMVYSGTGIMDKSGHTMSVVFKNQTDPNEIGVLVYQIGNDGTLKDTWTFFNKTEIGHGICRKNK